MICRICSFSVRPEVVFHQDLDRAMAGDALNQFERNASRQGEGNPSHPERAGIVNRGPALAAHD